LIENRTKLRIIHVSTVHHDEDTRIFEKECCGLAAKGHDVTLIVKAEKNGVRNGVRIVPLPRNNRRLVRMTVGVLRAARIVLTMRADIYHLHDPELLPVGLLLRTLGYRVIYDMHENVPEQIRTKKWLPLFLRGSIAYIVHLLERLTLRKMPVVMAEYSYADCYNWIKSREVVLNLPKLKELTSIRPKHKNGVMVGYVGVVSRDRGILTAIKAIHSLRAMGLPVEFQCVGNIFPEVANDPIYQQGFRTGWLRSPGWVSPKTAWSMIASCQVGLAVLKPIANYVSSYPTKMFEYMAMGLPVIVSNFPLYRDVVELHKCGICVDPEDTDAIADAILFFINNPGCALEMGNKGQKAVLQYYNWETELNKLNDFYHAIIAGKK